MANALDPRDQQARDIGQVHQQNGIGIDPQFGKTRRIGLAARLAARDPQPHQRPRPRAGARAEQQGKRRRRAPLSLGRGVEFMHPVAPQTAVQPGVDRWNPKWQNAKHPSSRFRRRKHCHRGKAQA